MLSVWREMLILHCWFLSDFTYLFQFKLEVWTWWHGSIFSFLLVINIPDTEQRSCTRTYIQIVLFLWSRRMLKLNDPFTYELSANKFSHRSGSVSLPSVRDRCPLQQAAVNDVLCVCEQWLVVKWKITTGSELLRFLSVLSNYNVNINISSILLKDTLKLELQPSCFSSEGREDCFVEGSLFCGGTAISDLFFW